jgi:hypothetical protein
MPNLATERISQGLRWAGSILLLAGVLLVVVGIGFTRSADALITASVIAAVAFGLPGGAAFGMAMWFEHVAERIESVSDPRALRPVPAELRRNPFREPLRRYAFALAAVAFAWGLRYLLDAVAPEQVPFLTFFLAVIAAGWFGGFGPAALATAASLVITWVFYVKASPFLGAPDFGHLVVLGVFAIVCLCIAAITAALHAALERSQELTLEVARLRAVLGEATEAPPDLPPALPPP